jgi:hypothetical protein
MHAPGTTVEDLVARSSPLMARKLIHQREMETHFPQTGHTSARSRKHWNKQSNRKGLLLAEAESLNNRFVALGIVFFEVVEQATPLADQHEKTAA